jgi:acetyl esterase/lipase
MSILTNPKNAVKITRAARDESLGVRNNSMVVGEVYACSFPAAIQDALSAHLYLISSGVDARDIVLSGDSADANIVLVLLRYLNSKEAKNALLPIDSKQVTTPGGAILWSPWFDIAGARNDPGRVYRHRNAASDYITGECRVRS